MATRRADWPRTSARAAGARLDRRPNHDVDQATGSASANHLAGTRPAGRFIRGLACGTPRRVVAGSMIGSGIFIVSADIARQVGAPGWLLVVWLLTGVMTIIGALSYGELAAMMPHAGGQYVFLREAYGPLVGFLYGWTLFTVIQTGTIAAVAVAFAKFPGAVLSCTRYASLIAACGRCARSRFSASSSSHCSPPRIATACRPDGRCRTSSPPPRSAR